MPEEDEPAPAELAHRIQEADRPSKPLEKRLRFQWNVPYGTSPFVPLWFALTVIALFAFGVLWAVFIQ